MEDPLAYITILDPDMMYFDQATKQPDRKELLDAAIKEVNSHCEFKNWKILPRSEVSNGKPIMDFV